MSVRRHILGSDAPSQGLLIRVLNAPDLVRQQGAVASAAQYFADQFGAQRTMERKVLEGIADQMRSNFKDKGVRADLSVVSVPELQPSRGALGYVGAGLLGASAVGLAWIFSRWGRR